MKFNLSKFCITLLLAACNSDSTANYPDKINVESGSTNVVDASSEYTMASTSERQYKRTLQTPWGPRDIYDPAKDPEVKKLFEDYRNVYENGPYPTCFRSGRRSEYTGADCIEDFYSIFVKQGFRRVVDLDLGRVGCKQVIDNSCGGGSVDFFAKNCGKEHNFGSAELSQCEKDNYRILLPRGQALITACDLNERRYDAYAYKTEPDIEKALQHFSEIQCISWTPNWEQNAP